MNGGGTRLKFAFAVLSPSILILQEVVVRPAQAVPLESQLVKEYPADGVAKRVIKVPEG